MTAEADASRREAGPPAHGVPSAKPGQAAFHCPLCVLAPSLGDPRKGGLSAHHLVLKGASQCLKETLGLPGPQSQAKGRFRLKTSDQQR